MATAESTKSSSMRWKSLPTDKPHDRSAREGSFVLENAHGEVVRYFRLEGTRLIVIIRRDTGRVEMVSTLNDLEEAGVKFDILAETSPAELRKSPLAIAQSGQIRFVETITEFSPEFELAPDQELEPKKAFGWSLAAQLAVFLIFAIAGAISGMNSEKPEEVTVTLLTDAQVEKMLKEDTPLPKEEVRAAQKKVARKVVVAPTEKKIKKSDPIPTRSTSMKKTARLSKKGPLAGGHKGEGKRGYGTNEPNMNSIGALGALTKAKGRGNGGRGGVNLQAVGSESGSGAGGRGHGGFGNSGAGGRGRGGIGKGQGTGLANAMYGKGLMAAPFGEGSAAPGAGGYGTRGKAGGGEAGAGYGRETMVGSWKGTGMHGNGPAGSGSGSGIDGGSLYGSATGDEEDVLVQGGLDRDQINEVIMRNIGQITYCYEQGLQKKGSLSGRVAVRFQIGPRGAVTTAGVAHSSVRSAQVEGCIVGKLRNWKFPKPHGGVTVAVTYPFTLRRVSQK